MENQSETRNVARQPAALIHTAEGELYLLEGEALVAALRATQAFQDWRNVCFWANQLFGPKVYHVIIDIEWEGNEAVDYQPRVKELAAYTRRGKSLLYDLTTAYWQRPYAPMRQASPSLLQVWQENLAGESKRVRAKQLQSYARDHVYEFAYEFGLPLLDSENGRLEVFVDRPPKIPAPILYRFIPRPA